MCWDFNTGYLQVTLRDWVELGVVVGFNEVSTVALMSLGGLWQHGTEVMVVTC